ncbi:hypothetical protein FISHEDRAFT_59432 [Fistulina hepatica ATCC 64428]|uniref:YDG domain-containing protein n=1 Tax=Fistulina hepatica ATCC 64428 TaxID=1128425 RepID=A0A0D7AA34_9AGAR|nr:hypothetical protein FISHEDRAFT_59432 [Fistulina hepatica ATCC 64428]
MPLSSRQQIDAERKEEFEFLKQQHRITKRTVPSYGMISGIEVGSTWPSRAACAEAGVHVKRFAGICGGLSGATSVVLGGVYEDEDDDPTGETFTYSGTGGTENSFAGQTDMVQDQSFDHADNQSLKMSVTSKKPVRVVRAIPSGHGQPVYRYDGLYKVVQAYMGKDRKTNYDVCKYEFVREPNQPPLDMSFRQPHSSK